MASMTLWGSPSKTLRSMKAPGSPSSALQTTYLGASVDLAVSSHFTPVGNPPPPRPRNPESLTIWITCSGVFSVTATASAS